MAQKSNKFFVSDRSWTVVPKGVKPFDPLAPTPKGKAMSTEGVKEVREKMIRDEKTGLITEIVRTETTRDAE